MLSLVYFPSISYINITNIKIKIARKDYATKIGTRYAALNAILRAYSILGDATNLERALRLRPKH